MTEIYVIGGISILKKTVVLNSSGIVHTPSAGKKLRIYAIKFTLSADLTDISFRFTEGGTDFEKHVSPKTGGLYGHNFHPDYIEAEANQPLYCSITGSGTIQINIDYLEV